MLMRLTRLATEVHATQRERLAAIRAAGHGRRRSIVGRWRGSNRAPLTALATLIVAAAVTGFVAAMATMAAVTAVAAVAAMASVAAITAMATVAAVAAMASIAAAVAAATAAAAMAGHGQIGAAEECDPHERQEHRDSQQ